MFYLCPFSFKTLIELDLSYNYNITNQGYSDLINALQDNQVNYLLFLIIIDIFEWFFLQIIVFVEINIHCFDRYIPHILKESLTPM